MYMMMDWDIKNKIESHELQSKSDGIKNDLMRTHLEIFETINRVGQRSGSQLKRKQKKKAQQK